MKKLALLPLCLGCVSAITTSRAIDLKESKITQVVNDVQIISAANQQEKNASVNDVFTMPDILRTGAASRAELVAADETVTRVGANTIFSFDPATRTIDLKQGSLLFHSPHGKGGGTIHTGSATASVLGTTLIVTTTPTGGMKVLDLEGNVEVKFLSGLKQSLDPGHMAFVMPGGKQLSPIIVFRLDAVTQQSLLVNGFNQNLASMPLIQQQVEKQLKLIESGKLTDHGQLAPADGNSQPLDLNTLQAALDQSSFNSAAVRAAFRSDVVINGPSLPLNHVFLNHKLPNLTLPYPNQQFLITGNSFFAGQPFEGLAARNITFNTIGLTPLSVDLSPYATVPEFDFVAAKNLSLAGSVDFNGLSANQSIVFSLVAGGQILVAPGITVRANVANFNWQTPDGITLDGVNVYNNVGNTSFGIGGDFVMEDNAYIQIAANLAIRTPGNISFSHATVGADSLIAIAKGNVDVESTLFTLNTFGVFTAKKTLTVNGSTFYANQGSGLLGFNSQAGSVNIAGSSFQSYSFSVNADDSITLDGSGQSLNAATANLMAPNLITLNNADFSNLGYLNAVAHTITIMGSKFNSRKSYNFGVATGLANINNGVVSGEANFINDRIDNTALTLLSQVDQTTGAKTTAGVHVYKK